jgi:hypothetical protein
MTDMHRDAFESQFMIDAATRYGEGYSTVATTRMWLAWKDGYATAIRHLTEQNEQRDSHE